MSGKSNSSSNSQNDLQSPVSGSYCNPSGQGSSSGTHSLRSALYVYPSGQGLHSSAVLLHSPHRPASQLPVLVLQVTLRVRVPQPLQLSLDVGLELGEHILPSGTHSLRFTLYVYPSGQGLHSSAVLLHSPHRPVTQLPVPISQVTLRVRVPQPLQLSLDVGLALGEHIFLSSVTSPAHSSLATLKAEQDG